MTSKTNGTSHRPAQRPSVTCCGQRPDQRLQQTHPPESGQHGIVRGVPRHPQAFRDASNRQVLAHQRFQRPAQRPAGQFCPRFANAAWLVLAVIAFNLTRAAATLSGPVMAKATTATIRRTLITVPAQIATSARRIVLHLPRAQPWETVWTTMFDRVSDPPLVHAA